MENRKLNREEFDAVMCCIDTSDIEPLERTNIKLSNMKTGLGEPNDENKYWAIWIIIQDGIGFVFSFDKSYNLLYVRTAADYHGDVGQDQAWQNLKKQI